MSQIVVVERAFAEPSLARALAERERQAADEQGRHGVLLLRTFTSRDLRRMLCFYEAPDAEAVRSSQEQAELALDRIWSGSSLLPPQPPASGDGYTTVVVERKITHDITQAQWWQLSESKAWCMASYRVALLESVFAPSHGRAVCVFIAPDTEAVRMANSGPGMPESFAWPCDVWRSPVVSGVRS
jgi:hypothetical protein